MRGYIRATNAAGTKEMMQPCPTSLHAISLVAHGDVDRGADEGRVGRADAHPAGPGKAVAKGSGRSVEGSGS